MTLQVTYSVSAGVTSDISSRVFMASERLGLPGVSLTQNAEEGSVGISTLVVDDSDSTLTLKGHRRIYFTETSAPTGQQVIANTYVGKKEISRGDWRVGPLARTFSVELADANTLISRRLVVGSDGNRPAETDVQRIQWLYGTTEANEFNGSSTYINTSGPVAMDAVDYRGQSVTQIIDDCAQASGKNWWIIYEESLGEFSLWYDFATSTAYSSTIRLSNDEADVDDSTTFAYFPDAKLSQDPSRVYSGTLVDFSPAAGEAASWVYEQQISTGNEFVFRDVAYPSHNVKTEAKARARAVRYNADSDEEDEVIKLSFVVPAGNVNSLMHGHRIEVKGTQWGLTGGHDYTSFTWMRALNRTVTQLAPTHYRIDVELTPVPTFTVAGQGILYGLHGGGPPGGAALWADDGDDPAAGQWPSPKTGPMDYYQPQPNRVGFTMTAAGTVSATFSGSLICLAPGGNDITWAITVLHADASFDTYALDGVFGATSGVAPSWEISASDIPVVSGDIVYGKVLSAAAFNMPAGIGANHFFRVTGSFAG